MASSEQEITIGDRRIGPGAPVYVIAEIGLNHNGDLAMAKRLVDAAVSAGADAVKFQKRRLRETYRTALIDDPRQGEQGLQYLVPLLKEFELSDDEFRELHAYCRQVGATFLCTPWDAGSVAFLETLDVKAYKIGSPDLTNFPLIDTVAATGKPLLVSTGMSTEDEIRRTLSRLDAHGVDYALFHCVSTYPADAEEINLRFMDQLREWSSRPVGYSGHDMGTAIATGAVALGARLVEKHLTLDKSLRGPDHKASLLPEEFADQIRAIREVEQALGVPRRWITRGETLNRRALGKSLVAARDLPAGTILQRSDLTAKSPGLGVSPQLLDRMVGMRIGRAVRCDEPFVPSDLGSETLPELRDEAINTGFPWGIVARFTDLDGLMARFGSRGMGFVEFHVSDRDLDHGIAGWTGETYPEIGFTLHAPEYCHDTLIDLCSADSAQRSLSVQRIQKTIELAKQLTRYFGHVGPRGPKVVIHVGGMSRSPTGYDHHGARERLLDSLSLIDHDGVDLLLENLPPFPWYFGGRWFGHVLCDAEDTVDLCQRSGLGLCFDTSHASLACSQSGASLGRFATAVAPFTRHLHISDGAGTSGEGLQIGDGTINFIEVLAPLLEQQPGPTMVPEIWMGHHGDGDGFLRALHALTDIQFARYALARAQTSPETSPLESLTINHDATLFGAIRAIDSNRMGIAFVVSTDERVQGVVTDGDIRHALVRGSGLHSPIAEAMTRDFRFGREGMAPAELQALARGRTCVTPLLDADGRLTGYVTPTAVVHK